MMRRNLVQAVFAAAALFAAGCGSVPAAAGEQTAGGVLTVTNIPQKYVGGVILVNGDNEKGEVFTYSPKTFQRCEGTTAAIKIYLAPVRAVQTPFLGSGEFLVTITLYEPEDRSKTEIRQIKANFVNGSATVRW